MCWFLIKQHFGPPPGEFSHLLPEEQIQPACEEAFTGALSIITYVHDKTFNNATLPSAAVTPVAGFMILIAVSVTTGVWM